MRAVQLDYEKTPKEGPVRLAGMGGESMLDGGLGDVREQLGERLAHREGLTGLLLGGEHVVDERGAMENALLLARQAVNQLARRGFSV